MDKSSCIYRGLINDCRRIKCRAKRFVAPNKNGFMNLTKGGDLIAAGGALFHMLAKIAGISLAGFAIKITDQVFRPMTNWSFIHVSHFESLLDHSTRPSPNFCKRICNCLSAV